MSNTFGMALMSYWSVGLNVNTLPVISLGIGFGEDYGIYIVSRAIEEYQRSGRSDLNRASSTAWRQPGKPSLHSFSDLGQHRLLGVLTAALSGRDGLAAANHTRHEYARRSVSFTCSDRSTETQICYTDKRPDRDVASNPPLYSIFLFSERHKRI